jgi:hypothetical protein
VRGYVLTVETDLVGPGFWLWPDFDAIQIDEKPPARLATNDEIWGDEIHPDLVLVRSPRWFD